MMSIINKCLIIIAPSWAVAYASDGMMAYTIPVVVAMTIIVSTFDKPKVDDEGGSHD